MQTIVAFNATVTSAPAFFTGRSSGAHHEAFNVRADDGTRAEIVDNVDIAPPVRVEPGDRVAVRGELVADAAGDRIVHWTHHDPAGRHPGGWIDFGGRRYA